MGTKVGYKYDIVISFAGEDREIAEVINRSLRKLGIRTFYDHDHAHYLWGKDLAEEFLNIYSKESAYCLMIISKYYKAKMWTIHERRAAISRMLKERKEYILPYIIDDSRLDDIGMYDTIGYLEFESYSPKEVVELLFKKLGVDIGEGYHNISNIIFSEELMLFIIKQLGQTESALSYGKHVVNMKNNFFCEHPFISKENYPFILELALNKLYKKRIVYVLEKDEGGDRIKLTEYGKTLNNKYLKNRPIKKQYDLIDEVEEMDQIMQKQVDRLATRDAPISKSDATTIELERLRREAMAASRRSPEDMGLFEQKLHEIDLLEECSAFDKVEALAELGLEVPLNSDAGTQLLVEHFLWQIAGWETQPLVETIFGLGPGRRLLKALASTLWEIGVEAIEYHRNKDTVQTVVDAILQVAEKARLLEASQALESCKAALSSMFHQAQADDRVDVLVLIQDASNELH